MNNYKFLFAGVAAILMSVSINSFGISFVFSENDSNYLVQAVNNTVLMTNPNANRTVIVFNTTNFEVSDFIANSSITLVDKIDPTLIGENETIFIYNATDEMGDSVFFTVPPINEIRSTLAAHFMDPAYSMAKKIDGVGLCKSNFPALEVYCQTLAPLPCESIHRIEKCGL